MQGPYGGAPALSEAQKAAQTKYGPGGGPTALSAAGAAPGAGGWGSANQLQELAQMKGSMGGGTQDPRMMEGMTQGPASLPPGYGQGGPNDPRAAEGVHQAMSYGAPPSGGPPPGAPPGTDPRAVAANPGGFQQWMEGAKQAEMARPGSTMMGPENRMQMLEKLRGGMGGAAGMARPETAGSLASSVGGMLGRGMPGGGMPPGGPPQGGPTPPTGAPPGAPPMGPAAGGQPRPQPLAPRQAVGLARAKATGDPSSYLQAHPGVLKNQMRTDIARNQMKQAPPGMPPARPGMPVGARPGISGGPAPLRPGAVGGAAPRPAPRPMAQPIRPGGAGPRPMMAQAPRPAPRPAAPAPRPQGRPGGGGGGKRKGSVL